MLLRQVDRWIGLTKISTITIFCAKNLLWQTASERSEELASCSTLCRLENRAGRKEAWLMHEVLFDQFLGSFESTPAELVLDFDCTDDRVHGLQEGRHFHGYYYDFCFSPQTPVRA